MSRFNNTFHLTVERAQQIQHQQVQHYSELLDTERERAAFLASVERLNEERRIESGWDVPRGVEIERLYFRAKGLTDADHPEYCSGLD